jgi:hypothetical protein
MVHCLHNQQGKLVTEISSYQIYVINSLMAPMIRVPKINHNLHGPVRLKQR